MSTPPPAPGADAAGPLEHRFPCPACGGVMGYDPGADTLTCGHCGHREAPPPDLPTGGLQELDLRSALERELPETETAVARTSRCETCGAQIEIDPDIQATECPFCASPVIVDTGEHRLIKPKGVLPFLLTERQAKARMKAWLGRLWFAPSGLAKFARAGRPLDGLYVPFWTYDAETRTRYRGQRGTEYKVQEPVIRDGKTEMRTVTKVRWMPAHGTVARDFDDVLVMASTSLPPAMRGALRDWDLSEMEPFAPQFLAGFRAEAYTVDLQDGFDQAREVMDRRIRRDIKFDIGGDRQKIDHYDTDLGALTFKHVLLPVWLAAFRYQGKSYRVAVNGRTGAVTGERPWSAWKIAGAAAAVVVVAVAVGILLAR